jgi:hypothetical protein
MEVKLTIALFPCCGLRARGPLSQKNALLALAVFFFTLSSINIAQAQEGSTVPVVTTAKCGKPVCIWKVFGPQTYVRQAGKPVVVTNNFSVLNPRTIYVLRAEGTALAQAKVVLNGKVIIATGDFQTDQDEDDCRQYRPDLDDQASCERNRQLGIICLVRLVTLTASDTISVELDGNPGSSVAVTIIGVDTDFPTVQETVSPAPSSFGWNNTNVTVSFTCSDATSGIASCPSAVTVSNEGAGQVVSGTAKDKAGNSATSTLAVNLDKTPPTITAVVSPGPTGGIYIPPVTIKFNCSDSLSGVALCSSPITVTKLGANQVFFGSATDKAGNTTSTSVTLNLGSANPLSISASAAPAANAAGWNNTPVTVTFTCSGGVAPVTCPTPQVVSTQGINQVVSGTATDASGKTATSSVKLNVELTPPSITGAVAPVSNAAGWNNTSVTVSFNCAQSLSAIASCPQAQSVATEGANQRVTGQVMDAASNTASASVTVNIDKTSPVIAAMVSATPNASGVYTAPVSINFTCTDALSGVTFCPAPVAVTTVGAGQVVSGTATDVAGNTAAASVTLNVEAVPLSITAAVSPAPNGASWNNTPVTATFTCNGGVPPLQCPAPQTINTDGAGQVIRGTVKDANGETASASVTVNLEQAPPTITAVVSPTPNAAGWNNTAVTGTFTCAPSVSPMGTCPAPQLVSTEGAVQPISGTIADAAGNSATANVSVSVDLTPPTIMAAVAGTQNPDGTYTAPLTVNFTCADSLSGVGSCPSPVTVTALGAGQAISGTATDEAGNTASALVTLNIESAPLSVTSSASPAPNAAEWNNSPVTVTFTCAGGVPPVQCPAAQTVKTDGQGQLISGTATDADGHSASASVIVNLDQTSPVINVTSPSNFSSTQAVLQGLAFDVLSGLTNVTCNGAPATMSGQSFSCNLTLNVGSNTVVVTASDAAGNTATSSFALGYVIPINVQITSPAALQLFSANPITVIGTVDNPNATVTVGNVTATVANGTFTANGVALREAKNLLTASATSPDGGVGSATVTVYLDTTPPVVHIENPTDGATVNTPQIDIMGNVNDLVAGTVNGDQVSVSINGVSASVANRSFAAHGVLLVPGLNTVTATATDRAGNTSQHQIHVTLQQLVSQQVLSTVSGNNQSAPINTLLPQPLVVHAADSLGRPLQTIALTFAVAKSDGTLTAGQQQGRTLILQTDANGNASVQFQLGSRNGVGINQVAVTSPGFMGQVVFSADSVVGTASGIHTVSGEMQTGAVGEALGEPLVAIVMDTGGNPVANVPVTFTVQAGGGTIDGQPTLTQNTDSDGKAYAVLVLGQQEGIRNNVVNATIKGGSAAATFTSSAVIAGPVANTSVSGIVLDDSDQPIPNARASIEGTTLSAITDATGRFTIPGAPVGNIVLFVNGITSTRSETFPTLSFQMATVPGIDNTLSAPIFLPVIDTKNSQVVGGDQPVQLTMAGVPGVVYTVWPNSVTFPDGSHVGRLTLSQVHADKVPMTPPNGGAPTLVGTLQPAGVVFNPPIQIQLPNTEGFSPGQVVEIFSFHHDVEQFVTEGTAHVTQDGSSIISDSGFGLTVSGWHGGNGPPPPPTCGDGCKSDNSCVTKQCVNGVCVPRNVADGTSCQDNTRDSQCGQNGQCKDGECNFQSESAKGTNCTPSDAGGDDSKTCGGQCDNSGKCIGTPFNPVEASREVEMSDEDDIWKKFTKEINKYPLFGPVSFKENVSVSFEQTEKDCCKTDSASNTQQIVDGGETSTKGSISASMNANDVPIPGYSLSLTNRINVWPGTYIETTSLLGLFLDLSAGVTLEAGKRNDECSSDGNCFVGSLSASLTPTIRAQGSYEACLHRRGIPKSCNSASLSGEAMFPLTAGISENRDTCSDGYHGFVSFGPVDLGTNIELHMGWFSFGVTLKFQIPNSYAHKDF